MARSKKGTKRKADADVDAQPAAADSLSSPSLPVRAKDGGLNDSNHPSKPVQGTLKVFDDNDDEVDVAAVVKPSSSSAVKPEPPSQSKTIADSEEEDESDDDDDAPEAVSTQNVARRMRQSVQAAQRAAQEQAVAEKRKRQARDTLFKQQAEERKKVEKEGAVKATSAAAAVSEDNKDNGNADAGEAKGHAPARRRKLHKMPIPNVLPDELLTDSSSEDEANDDAATGSVAARPKRRKVADVQRNLTRLDRGPRDERVGSTVYRVAKETDERLPPKSKQYSRGTRDVLLRRNRTPVKPRGAFFKR